MSFVLAQTEKGSDVLGHYNHLDVRIQQQKVQQFAEKEHGLCVCAWQPRYNRVKQSTRKPNIETGGIISPMSLSSLTL